VDVSGLQDREVRVLLEQDRLQAMQLTQAQVVQAIQAGNIIAPAGTVVDEGLEANVRVLGQLEDAQDLESMILGVTPRGFLTLGEVAHVEDGWTSPDSIVRTNGQQAVVLEVRKEGDANLVSVNQAVLDRLEQLQADLEDVDLVVTMDQAKFIQDSIASIGQNLLVGAGLAILVLLIFLQSPLSTVVIAVAIPFSVLATFVLMQFTGLTLNIMSLGGLALGVGMMVDNSIVVIENIYRHIQEGLSAQEASARGTDEVAGAITGSTLTTLAVFLPVVYVGGITGELFKELAWTVSFSLLASLLVAVTVIPMLASRILPLAKNMDATKPRTATGYYARAVNWALSRRWLVLGIVGLVVALSILPFNQLGQEFLPSIDEGSFNISVTMPVGTPLEKTAEVAQEIEHVLADHQDIVTYSTQVGGSSYSQSMPQRGKNSASIDVTLAEAEERSKETDAVINWARARVEEILPIGTTVSVQRQDIISSLAGSDSLQVDVRGVSLDKVQELAGELRERLSGFPQLTEVKSSLDQRLPEQQVVIDRPRAASMGMVPAQVAAQVSAAKTGQVATRLDVDGHHIDVRVQCTGLDDCQDLGSFLLTTSDGHVVPLHRVAEIMEGQGPMTLHRGDQQISAQLTAIILEGDLGSVSSEVEEVIAEMDWPQGYTASIGGAGQLMQEGFDSLYKALALAVVLVYIVMAALFESLRHPLVILFTLPLAAVGAILALYFSDNALGITALIGIIMLAGIVVNNGIVMVDAINQLRAQGMSVRKGIVTGASQRLRPILMTAFTTIIAMLPLAMGIGEGAELQAPLATAVLGGLLSATILTLLVVPVVYSLVAVAKRKS